MAHPDPFTIASDANFTNPGHGSNGTSNKRDPALDGLDTRGWNVKEKPNVRHHNFLWELLGRWTVWLADGFQSDDNWNYPSGAKTGTVRISPHSGSSDRTGGGDQQPTWTGNGVDRVTGWITEKNFYLDITDRLPDGGSFVQVDVRVQPGSAQSSGDRMEFELWEVDYTASPPTKTQLGSTQEDDGTTVEQSLIIGSLGGGSGIAVDKTSGKAWIVQVRTNRLSTAGDDFLYARASISAVGPRAL